ncbi:hypothetical protein H0H92_002341, partial [Tricholoma furcatifolium]
PDVCKACLIDRVPSQSREESPIDLDDESNQDDDESNQDNDDIDSAVTDSRCHPAKLSEYEIMRQNNIERNALRLAEIDALYRDQIGGFEMKAQAPTPSKKKVIRPHKPKGEEPTRQSARISEQL